MENKKVTNLTDDKKILIGNVVLLTKTAGEGRNIYKHTDAFAVRYNSREIKKEEVQVCDFVQLTGAERGTIYKDIVPEKTDVYFGLYNLLYTCGDYSVKTEGLICRLPKYEVNEKEDGLITIKELNENIDEINKAACERKCKQNEISDQMYESKLWAEVDELTK